MKQICIILISSLSLNAIGQQSQAGNEKSKPFQVCETELKWSDTKPPLLPGAQIAILDGNPKESGHFTIRIKFPPYYKLPPHKHAVDERTTVIQGSIGLGFGEVADSTKVVHLTKGCYIMNPAGVVHYSFTGPEETIIQISTNGPWGLDLIKQKQ